MRFPGVLLLLATCLFADSIAGLKWMQPVGWKSLGRTSMRAATYVLPAAAGDAEAAECVVYFFGAGQGGTIEANLQRWKGQFTQADGKPAAGKVEKRTVHGLAVTTIESAGNYEAMSGPGMQAGGMKRNYRLLGAIVEGPGGNIFVKFTGPEKTVAAHLKKYEELLGSFQKE